MGGTSGATSSALWHPHSSCSRRNVDDNRGSFILALWRRGEVCDNSWWISSGLSHRRRLTDRPDDHDVRFTYRVLSVWGRGTFDKSQFPLFRKHFGLFSPGNPQIPMNYRG